MRLQPWPSPTPCWRGTLMWCCTTGILQKWSNFSAWFKLFKNEKDWEILWPLPIFLEGPLSSVRVSCTVPGHLADWVRVEAWEVAERGTQTRLVTQPASGHYGTSYQHHVLIICLVFAGLEVWMDAWLQKYLYTLKIFVRVFPVPCPVSAVAELSPIVHNSVSMSPDCECIQSCQMLKGLSRITVICMSYYHLSSIRSLTLFTNNIVEIQEWLIQEYKICNL